MKKRMKSDADRRPVQGGPRRVWIRYVRASVFCAVFSLIYSRFSHDIDSTWMTCLFLWPLLLGAVPAFLQDKGFLPVVHGNTGSRTEAQLADRKGKTAEGASENAGDGQTAQDLLADLPHFGIAAMTCASLLKGILEIAGTDSAYAEFLLYAGAVMLAAGGVLYLHRLLHRIAI